MTKAEEISQIFNYNNKCLEICGVHIRETCEHKAVETINQGELTRYEFPDGSAILVGNHSWGIEGDESDAVE